MRTILVMVLLGGLTWGDELVLKDGKKVPWSVLRDLGDSVEVETPDGVKLEIKKNDIAKIELKTISAAKKEELSTLLTGATFTWEKGRKLQQMDLLKSIDVGKDAQFGSWKMTRKGLVGVNNTGGGRARLETSYIPPEEYDLTLVLERLDGKNCFAVGLVGSGKQFTWCFEGPGGWTGPLHIDGKGVNENGVGVFEEKTFFPKLNTPRTVQFMIRKFGFAVRADGKDYTSWKGDWSKVGESGGDYGTTKKNVLFFACAASGYLVSQAVVTYPKE